MTGSPRGPLLYRAACRVEETSWLDHPAEVLQRLAPSGFEQGPVRDALGGRWLGHALHPMLTDFPLGAWMATSLLDVLPGRMGDGPSKRLLAFGLLAAVPTILSGWSDWLGAKPTERRVGVVHAVINTTAAGLYASSLAARLLGRHRAGVAFSIAGGVLATAGGFFGGHLSLARPVGLRNTAEVVGDDRALSTDR
jgi:uncharacterized membrane protein